LSNAGLVHANLSGAKLSGANLVGANLSQANLMGADLSGANLSGASLNGAKLVGANLTGANLTGADLRGAYLMNAAVKGVNIEGAYLQGVIGMPLDGGTPELFYSWGLLESKRGNFNAAIRNFNNSLVLNPDFAPAYLARAVTHYRLGQEIEAEADAKVASQMFGEQENLEGQKAADDFILGMENARKPPDSDGYNPWLSGLQKTVQAVGGILFQFVIPALGVGF
jgi:tetratricopeptide (TPR) repeat protein